MTAARTDRINRLHVINLNGMTATAYTPKRYLVVTHRAEAFTNERGTYVTFLDVILTTDSATSAADRAKRQPTTLGLGVTVIDTAASVTANPDTRHNHHHTIKA